MKYQIRIDLHTGESSLLATRRNRTAWCLPRARLLARLILTGQTGIAAANVKLLTLEIV